MESQEIMIVQPDELQQLSEVGLEAAIMNPKAMNHIFKMAKTFAGSSMIPAAYRGNPSSCFVACELAARMDVSPSFVMQNLYIVDGRPSWSGQACVALIAGCGLFRDVRYNMIGERGTPEWGCFLSATRVSTGERVTGSAVTLQLAIDEGWMEKRGSKWKTMPEQMLKYRAASFFARTECPNVLMGFLTDDETRDISKEQTEKVKVEL